MTNMKIIASNKQIQKYVNLPLNKNQCHHRCPHMQELTISGRQQLLPEHLHVLPC